MKTIGVTTLSIAGSVLGVMAQGSVDMDNSRCNEGVVLTGTTGPSASGLNWYTGTAGIQIWYLNGSTFNLNNINQYDVNGMNGALGYQALSANGFALATTFTGTSNYLGGFALGLVDIPGVAPAGSTITMAIAEWVGNGSSFPSGGGQGGVLAFYQPTSDYTQPTPPTPPDLTSSKGAGGAPGGFNTTDLILNNVTGVPEPSSFALAGLGAAALLIFRRRK